MQTQNVVVMVVTAIVVALVVLLLGGAGMMGAGMMGGFGLGLPLMGGLLMLLVPLLFISGVVWLVVVLARGSAGQLTPPSRLTRDERSAANATPLDILKMRYAKGEITPEQFDEMRKHLGM